MVEQPITLLIDALRGWSLTEIAERAGVTRNAAEQWRRRGTRPNPHARACLVEAAKQHAAGILFLVAEVERGGTRAPAPRTR